MQMNLSRSMRWLLTLCAVLLFAECEKDSEKGNLNGKGQTIVKIYESPVSKLSFLPFSGKRSVPIFELRRDIPNNTELNTPLTVRLKINPTLIADYNTENGTAFETLPRNFYTVDPSVQIIGEYVEVTFAPGEYIKPININLDGNLINLSKAYALGYSVAEASGKTISSDQRDVVVTINFRNKWDGLYRASGDILGHPTLTGPFGPIEIELVTAGNNSVYIGSAGAVIGQIYKDPATGLHGYFTGVIPQFVISPANDITVTDGPNNTVVFFYPAGGTNTYNDATKTFIISYGWVSTPNRTVTERFVYTGPRP